MTHDAMLQNARFISTVKQLRTVKRAKILYLEKRENDV